MSIKLILTVGDRVRNIGNSARKGWIGTVISSKDGKYTVNYQGFDVRQQEYFQDTAHLYLEKIEQPVHDYTRQEQKTLAFMYAYGAGMEKLHDYAQHRTVLNKVRRNVITGKTQDDFVRELGHARGVQQFNTRALGRTTGQAFRVIGDAMCNPGTEIRISKIDHAKESELCSTSWTTLDKHFRAVVQMLIGDMKGFTFTPTHIMFNPIVTEETYVTRSN